MGRCALTTARAAVFFDRDGVLNKADVRDGLPYPPKRNRIVFEDGVRPALTELSRVLSLMFVVTNQPDVARGTLARSDVEDVHRFLAQSLPLTAFYTCYHDDADDCTCRKPRPGLLERAAADYGVSLRSSYVVGDRWRDIEAGTAVGATTVFVDRGYTERAPARPPDITVSSTAAAVDAILLAHATRHGSER